MHRRKRIRRELRGCAMEIDGSGADEVDHSKPLKPSQREHAPTNIETLTNKIQRLSVKTINSDLKKKKKVRYIDTSKLLSFKRESKKDESADA